MAFLTLLIIAMKYVTSAAREERRS